MTKLISLCTCSSQTAMSNMLIRGDGLHALGASSNDDDTTRNEPSLSNAPVWSTPPWSRCHDQKEGVFRFFFCHIACCGSRLYFARSSQQQQSSSTVTPVLLFISVFFVIICPFFGRMVTRWRRRQLRILVGRTSKNSSRLLLSFVVGVVSFRNCPPDRRNEA